MKKIIYIFMTSILLLIGMALPGQAQSTSSDVVINEIMNNPDAVSDSAGEWFELYNPTGSDIDIDGWTVKDNDIDSMVIDNGGPLNIPAGGYLVLGVNGDSGTNGGLTVDYVYDGSNWFLGNSGDEVVLLDGDSNEIDRVEYDGGATFPDPTGASMALEDPTLDNNVGANWCTSPTPYGDGDFGTPGEANDCGATPPPPPETTHTIYEIQYTEDSSGVSPLEGEPVVTEGVVTAFFYSGGDRYAFIQDGTGPWNGLLVFEPNGFVNVGDLMVVDGTVSEYFGLTEIAFPDVTIISSNNSLPAPEVLPSGEVSQEMWESVLVRVENVTVTNEDLGFGEWEVDDGSGAVVVDDLGSYSYSPTNGDFLDYVQGPLNYSFGSFKIEPREDGDLGAPLPVIPIGAVQGVVADDDNGASHSSPYVGEEVFVRGVVYEKTQEYRSSGGAYYGFFMQNTAATADGDPNSSDGIFAFTYIYPTIPVWGGGYYEPQIGDELVIVGEVEERFGNTRLNFVDLAKIVRHGAVLDDEIPAFEANPPAEIADGSFADIQDAYRYWERHEGMRAQVPAGSIVLNGRDVFASSFDSEVWVARPDSLIAQRTELYANRAFRDPHPLDDIPELLFDNGNPYRILMGTFGVKAAEDDTTALLAPARTFDTLTNAPIGGVYYNFGKYSVQVDQQIELTQGVDPAENDGPEELDRQVEYSVVTFNVENLYDYVDDAFDGCDFLGNSGCPGVYPPFDYAPSSDAVYQQRLGQIAEQIVNDLHSPDIILVQEAEDQDVCLFVDEVFTCPAPDEQVNNADDKPDTLQELALKILDVGGPAYDAALDRDGADDRGIISGYLYRTDRVELLPAMDDNPVLGNDPQVDYPYSDPLPYNTDVQNPKALNAVLPDFVTGDTDGNNVFTRPPQVALFRIWRGGIGASVFEDVYTIDNHFSSGPDGRVGQRTEQASYNAAIVDALQMAYPGVYVSVGGDLNVYPRPDDPFPDDPSDQLAGLYEQGLTNLWDIIVDQNPASAYSYVYQGQAQTLDQIFVAPSWLSDLSQARMTHINADFPADYPDDGPRGTSDHDPVFAGYQLVPTVERLQDLLFYFDDNGMITGNNTLKALLNHLELAARFREEGKQDAYIDQLEAFVSQVADKTPGFVTQEAADALTYETELLLSLLY